MILIITILVGILYAILGINYLIHGNPGMSITFLSYAVSMIGLFIAGKS